MRFSICLLRCFVAPSVLSLGATLANASLVEATAPGAFSPALNNLGALSQQNVLGMVALSTPLVTSGGVTLQAGLPYLMTVNGNFDLTLWNFVTTLGALQANAPLSLAQGHLNTLLMTSSNNNVIPLPAAGWLFASGLAALGVALRKRRSA